MRLTARFWACALTLLALMLLLAACSTVSPALSPLPVPPPAIPPLPAQARQPATPPDCSPSCSAGLMRLREQWLALPMSAEPPDRPASGPTNR